MSTVDLVLLAVVGTTAEAEGYNEPIEQELCAGPAAAGTGSRRPHWVKPDIKPKIENPASAAKKPELRFTSIKSSHQNWPTAVVAAPRTVFPIPDREL